MEPLAILTVLVALAFLVETLIEFVFGTLFDKVPALAPYKWTLMYVAIVVGIAGAFLYQFDLLHILSLFLSTIASKTDPTAVPILPVTWYGMAITGIAVGKGSNYLHQFISKFFPAKAQA